ncbi:MAG: hypothetical protein EBU90_09815 [Proteobacteria bacterium]|nr:hypothetical protein [Pseudomonadota bacterium]NBP14548.1 hypothetical protein [bacterium]
MVKTYRSLDDYIVLYNNLLTEKNCNLVVQNSNFQWSKHEWSHYDNIVDSTNRDNEFDIAYAKDIVVRLILNSAINKALEFYSTEFKVSYQTHTIPRINKYNVGNQIESHFDHITSIFDESKKGIPTLSIVGILNSEFEGGQFYFWEDKEIKFSKGDILVFPSIFMYRHKVLPVTSGTRWSFVSWAY